MESPTTININKNGNDKSFLSYLGKSWFIAIIIGIAIIIIHWSVVIDVKSSLKRGILTIISTFVILQVYNWARDKYFGSKSESIIIMPNQNQAQNQNQMGGYTGPYPPNFSGYHMPPGHGGYHKKNKKKNKNKKKKKKEGKVKNNKFSSYSSSCPSSCPSSSGTPSEIYY